MRLVEMLQQKHDNFEGLEKYFKNQCIYNFENHKQY